MHIESRSGAHAEKWHVVKRIASFYGKVGTTPAIPTKTSLSNIIRYVKKSNTTSTKHVRYKNDTQQSRKCL